MKNCGEIIDHELTKRRIKRTELCAYLNISPQYMTKLLRKESLDAALLEKICQFLKMDPIVFFDYCPGNDNTKMKIGSIDQQVWAGDAHVNMHDASIELLNLLIAEKDARIASLEETNSILKSLVSMNNNNNQS